MLREPSVSAGSPPCARSRRKPCKDAERGVCEHASGGDRAAGGKSLLGIAPTDRGRGRASAHAATPHHHTRGSPGTTIEERFQLRAGGRNIGAIVRSGGTDQTLFFHTDHLGSVGLITNAAGGVTEQQFDPFGASSSQTDPELTRAGFTGHQHDRDLGLIDMKGRIYDPLAGRFMSADPVTQAPFWSQGLNPYSYVFNDPINNNDPSGFLALSPGYPAGGVITGDPLGMIAGIGFNMKMTELLGGGFFAGSPGSSTAVAMGTAAPSGGAPHPGGLQATGQPTGGIQERVKAGPPKGDWGSGARLGKMVAGVDLSNLYVTVETEIGSTWPGRVRRDTCPLAVWALCSSVNSERLRATRSHRSSF